MEMDDKRKQLCVVFDIDETLIHFVSKKYRNLWDNLSEPIKSRFNIIESGENIIILRPHIQELFEYFKTRPKIKVALWTYSEKQYSEEIARILSKEFHLPPDFFLFTWGAEDMETSTDTYESSGLPKDLRKIYDQFPNFNTFNTFIVDDLYKNIKHEININNSILIEPFAPFGTSKIRNSDIGSEEQTNLSNDTSFLILREICEKSLRDILNCDTRDIDDAFDSEPIFIAKRVKRMKLSSYLKTYAINFLRMMTIGKPRQTNDFIMVSQDYGNFVKGGTRKRNKKRKKSRKNRKSRNKK
jgi:hypothetical protein